ncbi:MAG: ABC transporter ATP-binding protein/permease [Oscillospiraceae bacterium]|nr:ABC transporter ATP-binding protein/permease [Oscillospiraceae bacterium]
MSKKITLKMIFGEYIKKNIPQYILGIAALCASCAAAVIIPQILGHITNSLDQNFAGEGRLSLPEISRWALLMLGLALVLFGLKFVFRSIIIGKSRDIECFLRSRLFAHFQTLPPDFYNRHKTGDLMAYVINDLGAVRMAFAMGFVFLVEGVLVNFSTIVVMATSINLTLTAIAIVPVIAAAFVIFSLRSKIRRKFTLVQDAFADLSDKIQENLSGIRIVKGYVQEKSEIQKLDEASRERLRLQMEYVKTSAAVNPAIQASFGVCFSAVLVFGAIFAVRGYIDIGGFVVFNTYFAMMLMPMTHLGRIVEIWQKAFASMGRLDEIFSAESDIADPPGAVAEEVARGEIEIKNLDFAYAGTKTNALEDISIYVPPGGTLGITGATGTGKTTLVNLLLRLYKIEDGKIFVDGVDINKRGADAFRKNIGYVPQDNFLFAAPIDANIKFFDELIKKEAVIDSAKLACVYENIMGFPKDFETVIGERGITLSGGQKQRISIARAVVKNPAVLILDDSLSAVDAATEDMILSNIKKILPGRTGIIISHRISAVKNADEIIYLSKGKIAERGSHEELIEKGGEYHRQNERQKIETEIYGDKIKKKEDDRTDGEKISIKGFFGNGGGGEL